MREIPTIAKLFALLIIWSCCYHTPLYAKPSVPRTMTIGQISAQEGSDFFTINVDYRIHGKGVNYNTRSQSRINTDSANALIRASPSVKFEIIAGNMSFRLVGAFKPKTHYTIDIAEGLHDGNGDTNSASLQKMFHGTFTTPAFKPNAHFLSKARYLPRLNGAELPFEYRNMDRVRIIFTRVPPQNLVFWMGQNSWNGVSEEVSEFITEKNMRLVMKADKKLRASVDLSALRTTGKGVYEVSLLRIGKRGKKETMEHQDSSLVVVTDLAAVAKQDGKDLYVWTRSAKDFTLKAGVRVQVMSFNNFEIAACTTDAKGACRLQGVMRQKKQPYALIMSTDDDLSYLRFSDVRLSNGDQQDYMRNYDGQQTAMEAYVYSSRGVYRPSEMVNLAAIVWSGARVAAKNIPLQWKILSPRQKVLREVTVHSSDVGMTTMDLRLDDYAATGKYQAVLSSGKKQLASFGFFVEEFAPERIALTVNADKPVVVENETATFHIDAKYLFGPPVANGEYQARFSLQPAWYTIPDHQDFSTGEYRINPQPPTVLPASAGVLDAQGNVMLDVTLDAVHSRFPTVMQLTALVDVNESGSGRVTHRSQSLLLSPHKTLLGLRKLDNSGGAIHVEGRIFTPTGKITHDRGKVKLTLLKIYSNWVYVWNPDKGYSEWHSEEVLMPTATTAQTSIKNGRFTARLSTGSDWGRYIVRATLLSDHQVADLPFTVGYPWYWRSPNNEGGKPRAPDAVRLMPSVGEAKVGDTVEFSFESPFTGTALFALEADTLLQHRWISVSKGINHVSIKVPDVLPNVYASLLIIKDPREGAMYVPARAWGNASLTIIPQDYLIDVTTTVPKIMQPNQDLKVELQANNNKKTAFTVAVVDEGILQLTRFASPKPIDYFFEPRRLGVSTFETVGWTFPRTLKKKHARTGGGEAGLQQGDRVIPVRLVSYWSGIVHSDHTGKATVHLPVPPFQGKLRVMVVAAQEGRVGHSEQFVTVRDPLVLQPTLPRFLQWGDQFDVPLFIVNTTDAPQTITAKVTASEGVSLKNNSKTVTVQSMASTTVHFPATVTAFAGTVDFSFALKAGALNSHDHMTLPVLPLTPMQTINVTLPTDRSFVLADMLPQGMRSAGLKAQISASTIPYTTALKQLRYVLHYPYGCIEQTTSSTMPLLYVDALLASLDPDGLQDTNVSDMVYRGINRILSMQTVSGGFSYWPGQDKAVLWGTAYATHALIAAKNKGYDVPEAALNDALDFIQQRLAQQPSRWEKKPPKHYHAKVYMVYVLALAGRHQKARLQALVKQNIVASNHATEDYFMLMMAATMAGEQALAERLVKKYHLFSIVEAGSSESDSAYWSSFRSDALRLSLAADIWPKAEELRPLIAHVAKTLATADYLNTQEVAWGISGLGKIATLYQGANTNNIALTLNGEAISPHASQASLKTWSFSGAALSSKHPMRVQYQGKQAPYLSATVTGYQKSLVLASDGNKKIIMKRQYFTMTGEPVDPMNLQLGQLLVVKLSMQNHSGRTLHNMALSDRLPAAFEIENLNLGRDGSIAWVDEKTRFKADYVDPRDDHINIFGDLPRTEPTKAMHYYYTVRAVHNGTFTAAPAKLEAMYEPATHVYTDYEKVRVR